MLYQAPAAYGLQQLNYEQPHRYALIDLDEIDAEELFSFKDFTHSVGKGLSKVGTVGKKLYDAASPVYQEAGKAWKAYDPESYHKAGAMMKPVIEGVKTFDAKDGWGQVAQVGGKMQDYILI